MVKNISPDSYKYLQLNSGAVLYDVDLDDVTGVDELRELLLNCLNNREHYLGATKGNAKFYAIPHYKRYCADGKTFNRRGSLIADSWDIRLEVSLLEFSPDVLSRISTFSTVNKTVCNFDLVNMSNSVDENYITNIIWIGDWADHGLIAIELRNVVNSAGFNINITENGEGYANVVFVPHQGDYFEQDMPPFNVYFFTDIDK